MINIYTHIFIIFAYLICVHNYDIVVEASVLGGVNKNQKWPKLPQQKCVTFGGKCCLKYKEGSS